MIPITGADLKSSLPDTSGTVRLSGLDGHVDIFRDGFGIPHVRAGSAHDAFFGQGFATVQDRLWHMEVDRRRAYGRWAEYAGKQGLEQDIIMRRFQIGRSVRTDYQVVNADTRSMIDAYAAGVNAFIETTESLPVEYGIVGSRPEPWTPWDCMAVYKVRHILMGGFEGKLWRARLVNALGPERAAELWQDAHEGQLLIVPPGAEYDGPVADALEEFAAGLTSISGLSSVDAGSNSWVLSGGRTASGKPLMAGDPHRALDSPNVYYQNHVSCPEFDVVGLSFPGLPGFPHFGHNAHVAWCVTHAMADYQDLYIERFKDGSPDEYEFRGTWRLADVRHEVIQVRGGRMAEIEVATTDHGPVIAGNPSTGHAIAFKYTATAQANRGFESMLQMLGATCVDETEEAMRGWVDPCNNFLMSDVHGHFGYLTRGKVPIRTMANAWLPVPGWTGDHEWQGYIPFEEMPRSREPRPGYVVTANNRIAGSEYPHHLSLEYAPDYRARRITERIGPLDNATVDDMAAVHAERVSIPGTVYARLLGRIDPLEGNAERARQLVAAWDGSMERDSAAPAIYSATRRALHEILLRHLLGPLAEDAVSATGRGAPSHLRRLEARFVRMARADDRSPLPAGEDWRSSMSQALVEGVAYLTNLLGDDVESWTWGKVHLTRPRHPLSDSFPDAAELLDPPSIPMGGDGDTPQAASFSPADPFAITSTSVARYVFDTGDWSASRWVVPLGASGHPGSPHYADQAPIWSEVGLVPMLYDWARIADEAESRQVLGP